MDTQEALITSHLGYARSLARQVHKTMPRRVSFDDLEAAAYLGLTKAGASFDPARGVPFTTYSYRFIRGAVFDALRKMTWLSPGARRAASAQEHADQLVEDYAPALEEVDDPVQLAAQFSAMVSRLGTVLLMSDLAREGEDRAPEPEELDRPVARIEDAELRGRLRKALEALEPSQAELMDLLYAQGLTMELAGKRLGVNKATISRRHQTIIEYLRACLTSPNPVAPRPAPA